MKLKIMISILVGSLSVIPLSACGNAATATANKTQEKTEDSAKADASYEEGRAYLYGMDGKEINYESAYNSFVQALENGKTEANFYLGELCSDYGYPEEDYEKAKSYYEAAGDNPYARIALGILYYKGRGVETDEAKAKELFDAVIAEGCDEGYLGNAFIAYDNEDYAAVMENCLKATEGLEPVYVSDAMQSIGWLYATGSGVDADPEKAIEWYEKAADFGNPLAMTSIGRLYEYGNGIGQDYAKAMEWYEKAADLGDANAKANIERMHEAGKYVTQDTDSASENQTEDETEASENQAETETEASESQTKTE